MAVHIRRKVAVVTGAAEGCGAVIVKNLCKILDDDGDVYLTSRNDSAAAETISRFYEEGIYPKFFHLDITNKSQVLALRDMILKEYGTLDILVNNAATGFLSPNTADMVEMADQTFETNYFATLRVCQVLLPIMADHGRVVNMSSRMGRLCLALDEGIRNR